MGYQRRMRRAGAVPPPPSSTVHFDLTGPPVPCFMLTVTIGEQCGPCWVFVGPEHSRFMFSESLTRKIESLSDADRDAIMQKLADASPRLIEEMANSLDDAGQAFAESAAEGWAHVGKPDPQA